MLHKLLVLVSFLIAIILMTVLFYNVFVFISPPIVITNDGEIHRTMPIAHIIFATGASLICGIIMLIKYIKHLSRNN